MKLVCFKEWKELGLLRSFVFTSRPLHCFAQRLSGHLQSIYVFHMIDILLCSPSREKIMLEELANIFTHGLLLKFQTIENTSKSMIDDKEEDLFEGRSQ